MISAALWRQATGAKSSNERRTRNANPDRRHFPDPATPRTTCDAKGELPNPLNPPDGCAFASALSLRRGRMSSRAQAIA